MRIKEWIKALRLWSLTAATIPVLVGSACAYRSGRFSWAIFTLTMLSGWALQVAVNLLNTYGDYCSGVDFRKKKVTCVILINGQFKPWEVLLSALIFTAAGSLLGIWAAALSSWKLLFFALPGLLGVICYTTGTKYKYVGLGVPAVFVLMGVVMVMAAYFAHTCALSWTALVVSLPVSALVAVILHGNDLRDFESDAAAGITTTASMLGLSHGKWLFCVFHGAAYIAVAVGVVAGMLPVWTLLALLAAPLSYKVCETCLTTFQPGAERAEAQSLVAVSAQTHLLFGILLTVGLAVG